MKLGRHIQKACSYIGSREEIAKLMIYHLETDSEEAGNETPSRARGIGYKTRFMVQQFVGL